MIGIYATLCISILSLLILLLGIKINSKFLKMFAGCLFILLIGTILLLKNYKKNKEGFNDCQKLDSDPCLIPDKEFLEKCTDEPVDDVKFNQHFGRFVKKVGYGLSTKKVMRIYWINMKH